MLVDNVKITVKAGNGGRGNTKTLQKRPVGGDGGKGGDVYLRGNENFYDLGFFRGITYFEAENGSPGLEGDKHGKSAEDLFIDVPLGTSVYIDDELKGIIQHHGQELLILKGKRGSIGNIMQKAHPHRLVYTQEELIGETAELTLDMKLSADILFIGYPNAGKSSMLNRLTNAKAKVAVYPFTTLEPQLGRMDGITLMDLPGLIDGTHEGKGLGTHFVKHTEKSLLVAHFVSLENENPVETYKNMREEIGRISPELFKKDELVILTKTDEVTLEKINQVKNDFAKIGTKVTFCSILDDTSIEETKKLFTARIQEKRQQLLEAENVETTLS